jgi:hypothetical protein
MKRLIRKGWFITLLVVLSVVLIGGAVWASAVWNSANIHGSGTVSVTTTQAPIASFSATITADSTGIGSVSGGTGSATLPTGGVPSTMHTLGTSSPAALNIANGNYGFTLQASGGQSLLLNYFTNVVGLTGTNLTYITNEINGSKPFFFLNISGTGVNIYDGFQDQLGNHTAPLVINDDYPVGTYTYTGTLTSVSGALPTTLPITITLQVTDPIAWSINNVVVTGSPVVTVAFTSPTVAAGGAVSATGSLGVKDVGSTAIGGWTLGSLTPPSAGSGWNIAVSTSPVAAGGGTATLTFTLSGTAPAVAGTIDFSTVAFTLTPHS